MKKSHLEAVVFVFSLALLVTIVKADICTPRWTDSYRCSDSWVQRLYTYGDCSSQWLDYQYCINGCSFGSCVTPTYTPRCSLWVDVSTPNDISLGETISTTVTLKNTGTVSGDVNVDAYVCRSDGTLCELMRCDGYDPRIHLGSQTSFDLTCTKTAYSVGDYKIKIEYSGCDVDPTIYSGIFRVLSKPRCTPGYTYIYQCLGNSVQRQYQQADCSYTWNTVEYCPYGCMYGQCIQPKGIPMVLAKSLYQFNACEESSFTFDVKNIGDAKDTFKLDVSGSAARWIDVTPTVTLDKNEKKSVTAFVSIPCKVEGEYEFTVKASDKAVEDTDSSVLQIFQGEKETRIPVISGDGVLVIGLIVVVVIIVAFIVSYAHRLPIYVKKRPESF